LSPIFKKWMNTSNCIFYINYNDNKKNEKGSNWIKANNNIKIYPFIRIY
jgi:hypothetical protein